MRPGKNWSLFLFPSIFIFLFLLVFLSNLRDFARAVPLVWNILFPQYVFSLTFPQNSAEYHLLGMPHLPTSPLSALPTSLSCFIFLHSSDHCYILYTYTHPLSSSLHMTESNVFVTCLIPNIEKGQYSTFIKCLTDTCFIELFMLTESTNSNPVDEYV